MLSIRGTNFIAHWAYGEQILSHAEHTGNRFHRMLSMRGNVIKVEYLGRIEYDFQKSRVTGPWDHKDSVSAKKVKKNISCLCTFKSIHTLYFTIRRTERNFVSTVAIRCEKQYKSIKTNKFLFLILNLTITNLFLTYLMYFIGNCHKYFQCIDSNTICFYDCDGGLGNINYY